MNSTNQPSQGAIAHFDELNQMVIQLTGNALIAELWWNSKNSAFGNTTPAKKAAESKEGHQQVSAYLQRHSGDLHGL